MGLGQPTVPYITSSDGAIPGRARSNDLAGKSTAWLRPAHCFSSLKLIKTHLRTTMLDNRLSDIAMLSVHSRRANALDLDLVVDKFANKYPNCRIMLC